MPTRTPSFSDSSASVASAFLQQLVARLLSRGGVDADAAAAHLQRHRQQVDLEPVGIARSFTIEDRIRISKSAKRVRRVSFGVRPDKARWQLPDVRLQRVLLADLEAERL